MAFTPTNSDPIDTGSDRVAQFVVTGNLTGGSATENLQTSLSGVPNGIPGDMEIIEASYAGGVALVNAGGQGGDPLDVIFNPSNQTMSYRNTVSGEIAGVEATPADPLNGLILNVTARRQ